MGKFGNDAGVTPLIFFKGHPGICNDHRESGPRFNVSSKGQFWKKRRSFWKTLENYSVDREHFEMKMTFSNGSELIVMCKDITINA